MADKSILPQSGAYRLVHQSFKEWLVLLNYSAGSVQVLPGHVAEFLRCLEAGAGTAVPHISATAASEFIGQLKAKTGERTGKPFSHSHINKYVQALNLFSRYLRESGRSSVGFNLKRLAAARAKPSWLTLGEIQALYEATGDSILGIRDRAMLAVFYGCGLRLKEGASLQVGDLLAERRLLHVRKGKHYKERLVPVAEKNLQELKLYIECGRPQLVQGKTDALFIGANKGVGMDKQSLYIRVKGLVRRAGIQKKVGAHTLRHSIATHLLHSGMKLERIQQFLGHSGLDSTQIYTHLKSEAQ